MSNSSSITENLISELEHCAKKYSNDHKASFYESKKIFKNKVKTFDNISVFNIDIYFNSYIVRFSYYPRVPLTTTHSVLTCFLSLEKAESHRLFYPLIQLCGYLGVRLESASTIPLILSTDSMKECFNCITDNLKTIILQIQDLSYDTESKETFFDAELEAATMMLKSEYPTADELQQLLLDAEKELYPIWETDQDEVANETEIQKDFHEIMSSFMNHVQSLMDEEKRECLGFYYNFIMVREVSSPHEAYMTGNYNLSLKKFRKQKYISPYENMLIHYMKRAKASHSHVPDSIYKNLIELYKNGIPKNNFKESLAFIPAMLLFGLMLLPLFLAIYFLFYHFESIGAIYLLGPLENVTTSIIPAMLCSIPMIYFNSKRFYKIFFRKNYHRLMELDNALKSRSTHKFMKVLTIILILGSISFLGLTVHQNINLTETGLYDNTQFWNIHGDYYTYDEIDKVYYRDKTSNGVMHEKPSYVIRMKHGKEIDPYFFNTCDEKFLESLRKMGVYVES